MSDPQINIKYVDHLGIRVTDPKRAMAFYEVLGFKLEHEVDFDAVIIIKNPAGVEINLIVNGVENPDGNILMDVPVKHTGHTHIAWHVSSIKDVLTTFKVHGITPSQGPVRFGDSEEVSVFVRDPDLNVIELRGTDAGLTEEDGLEAYVP